MFMPGLCQLLWEIGPYMYFINKTIQLLNTLVQVKTKWTCSFEKERAFAEAKSILPLLGSSPTVTLLYHIN